MKKLTYAATNHFSIGKLLILILFIVNTSDIHSQTWSAIGNGGMNDWVYASTIYNGNLIVGGKFTFAGGVSANHIASWDGSNWSPLGLGVNGKVNALIVKGGLLYVGGEFTEAGGIPMNFIAIWDGTQWLNDLGDMGSIVTSFAIFNNKLVVGGYFTDADGIPANYITHYTNNGWAPLGAGMGGSQGQVMTLTVHNNELIAGGFFTTAGGTSASHIAKWNGSSWSPIGSGISGIVYALHSYNGNLVAGGLFLNAGGSPANHIAMWDGTNWTALGGGMSGTFYQYVFALTTYNGNLIAGGYFTHSDGIQTNGIAKWNGTSWSEMGGGFFYPANVYGAHTFVLYGNELVVGGLFSNAGGTSAGHIASWYEAPTSVHSGDSNKDLLQLGNYPNPFSDQTNITYNIPHAGNIQWVITDVNGNIISKWNETRLPGKYTFDIDSRKLSSGVYFLKMNTNDHTAVIRIIKN